MTTKTYDAIVVGAGVSGSFIATELRRKGMQVLLLEAGKYFNKNTYPTKEIDANAQLYWSGGIELNTTANLGLLRPKVVGGGSIVNQALLDRFDSLALDSWKEKTGIDWMTRSHLDPYYDRAEQDITIQEIPAQFRNGNANIFQAGFDKNGYQWAPLKRAQKDCRYEDGNDCIECLSGCRIDSKQSTPVTLLNQAVKAGLALESEFEVIRIEQRNDVWYIHGHDKYGDHKTHRAGKLVLASGAIGNSKLLLSSEFSRKLPHLGKDFYTHPQSMMLGLYERAINAHKGPLQSLKSDDPNFRINRFKLENVFAPPVAISMLIPGIGKSHMTKMRQITHMACVEVAIRDSNPGRISLGKNGKLKVEKELNERDLETQNRGKQAIRNIFQATGAREIIDGTFSIGLHLMGGCILGTDPKNSVVNPNFEVHGYKNLYAADSSVFPNAPGINPSLTIMAFARKAAENILEVQ